MGEALLDRGVAPGQVLLALDPGGAPVGGLQAVRVRDEALGGVGAAVEDDVLDAPEEVRRDLRVDAEHARVDDRHVEAGRDRMVEEHRVHGLAHGIVAAEREGDVGDAPGDLRMGQRVLDDPGGLEEIDGIVVVLLDPRGDGQDVRVEDDVLGREADGLGEKTVGARADADLLVPRRRLALLVERHDDGGGPVAQYEPRAAQEFILAVLERDRVDDALSLKALEPGLQDAPLGGVEHHRHPAYLRLRGDQVEELDHRRLSLDEGLVDVDVDGVGPVLDLLARDGEARVPLAGLQRLCELGRARDVRALADDDEPRCGGPGWVRHRLSARLR